jgi:hypothetical protein
MKAPRTPILTALAALLTLPLLACTALPPRPGDPAAAAAALGPPTGRHRLDDGAERLEFASGPYGRTTWMVDVGADGRVRAATQVLNEAHFAVMQERAPGLPRDQLLRELGRPGEVTRVGHPRGELWSWRYPTNDCLLFQVAVGEDGKAISASYNIDWRCDARGDARN